MLLLVGGWEKDWNGWWSSSLHRNSKRNPSNSWSTCHPPRNSGDLGGEPCLVGSKRTVFLVRRVVVVVGTNASNPFPCYYCDSVRFHSSSSWFAAAAVGVAG